MLIKKINIYENWLGVVLVISSTNYKVITDSNNPIKHKDIEYYVMTPQSQPSPGFYGTSKEGNLPSIWVVSPTVLTSISKAGLEIKC